MLLNPKYQKASTTTATGLVQQHPDGSVLPLLRLSCCCSCCQRDLLKTQCFLLTFRTKYKVLIRTFKAIYISCVFLSVLLQLFSSSMSTLQSLCYSLFLWYSFSCSLYPQIFACLTFPFIFISEKNATILEVSSLIFCIISVLLIWINSVRLLTLSCSLLCSSVSRTVAVLCSRCSINMLSG